MAISFNVPTIDISAYLKSPSSPESKEIIEAVKNASASTGFFQLTGHGIPTSLQEAVFKGSETIFNLPNEIKDSLARNKSVGKSMRGYDLMGKQVLQNGTLPDLKEGFYIGKEIPASDPRVEANAFLIGPNMWPDTSVVPEEEFRKPMEEYYERMFGLCVVMLDVIAKGLGYGDHVFDDFIKNDPIASIRLLHYPPDNSNDDRQLGAGAHTDFGAITLLLQDSTGGLQVWDEAGERWVDVVPNPGAYVVNIGDMLQMWTRGAYKSSLHRVLNRSGKHRYSVPFFFDGNGECVLGPLDGVKEPGKKYLTVEQHMQERFGTTYGNVEAPEGVENVKV